MYLLYHENFPILTQTAPHSKATIDPHFLGKKIEQWDCQYFK